MTQEKFAEILGVSNRSISRWETGRNLPDLSLLQIIAQELNVSISELLNGARFTNEELITLRNSINFILEISSEEKEMKKNKLNIYLITGLLCFFIIILNAQFDILTYFFNDYISEFIAGTLTGLGLLFEIIGIYYNNHDKSFKQRKREVLSHK